MNRSDEKPLEPYDATIEPRRSESAHSSHGVTRLRGRRSRTWQWVVPLVALVVLGAWILRNTEVRREARNAIASEERGAVGTSGRAGGTITDLSAARAAEPGRRVELSSVPVTAVTNGETFSIGSGSERLTVRRPGAAERASEAGLGLRPGQLVDLSGTLRGGENGRYIQADQVRIR